MVVGGALPVPTSTTGGWIGWGTVLTFSLGFLYDAGATRQALMLFVLFYLFASVFFLGGGTGTLSHAQTHQRLQGNGGVRAVVDWHADLVKICSITAAYPLPEPLDDPLFSFFLDGMLLDGLVLNLVGHDLRPQAPRLFPHGLAAFADALDLSLILYTPYFSEHFNWTGMKTSTHLGSNHHPSSNASGGGRSA